MPPKVKITKEDILKTAIDLVREKGATALNARAIAHALHCSTQPVFSNFSSMNELEEETASVAYNTYLQFIKDEVESGNHPTYKAYGIAYIRFAKEEKELFKLLFMCDRTDKNLSPTQDFNESVELIMKANGIAREKAELMHLECWACVHGIATILATSFLPLEWDLISRMTSDVYQGIRTRHFSEVTQK